MCKIKATFLLQIVAGAISLKLGTVYEWKLINFTWPSPIEYDYAVYTKSYIPENNIPTGIKVFKDKMYIALGRRYSGTPVTLAYVSATPDRYNTKDAVLVPFPSWNMNVKCDCNTLQNVNSIEIDTKGIMWILDGRRDNTLTDCPAKLVLLDIKSKKVLLNYVFPEYVTYKGFLADIVVDDNFAYISDSSVVDPGLIVFSRQKLHSWKVRDESMYPQLKAANFTYGKTTFSFLSGISGIALSPSKRVKYTKYVYFNAISSLNIWCINAFALQDENLCKTNEWRKNINFIGTKRYQSSGLMMDQKGNLYFGLLNYNALARWTIYGKFSNSIILFKSDSLKWITSFTFNSDGNLYVLSNSYSNYLATNSTNKVDKNVKFTVMKVNTDSKSYLYVQRKKPNDK